MGERRSDLDTALEELYGLGPSEFTARRDVIAKKLKADGEAADATSVRALRRPTQVAWVLNQLVRRHPDEIAALVDTGRELARAQRKALRGEAGASFRESIARQRQVLHELTKTATVVMKELGVDVTGNVDEVASALRAALVDPIVGARLEEGRLVKAPEPAAGFAGALTGFSAAPARPTPAKPTPTTSPKPSHAPASRKHARPTRATRRRAATAVRDSSKEKANAKAKATAAVRAKEQAAARAARAKERAAEVEAARARKTALADARRVLAGAEKAAAQAHAEADRAAEKARRADAAAKASAERAAKSVALRDDAKAALDELAQSH